MMMEWGSGRFRHMEETALRALVYLRSPGTAGVKCEIQSACVTMRFLNPNEAELAWMEAWVRRKSGLDRVDRTAQRRLGR